MSSSRAAAAVLAALSIAGCASGRSDSASGATTAITVAAPTTSAAPKATPTPPPTTAAPSTASSLAPLFVFPDAASAEEWRVINDTVMGGISNGEVVWADGALTFTGALSLANNGGFASIRSPEVDPEVATAWASRSGMHLEVDGGGRTWTIELRTDSESGVWISSFPTAADGPSSVDVAWTSFEPVTRFHEPRTSNEALAPERIETVGFFLVDGYEGPFRLAVFSIG